VEEPDSNRHIGILEMIIGALLVLFGVRAVALVRRLYGSIVKSFWSWFDMVKITHRVQRTKINKVQGLAEMDGSTMAFTQPLNSTPCDHVFSTCPAQSLFEPAFTPMTYFKPTNPLKASVAACAPDLSRPEFVLRPTVLQATPGISAAALTTMLNTIGEESWAILSDLADLCIYDLVYMAWYGKMQSVPSEKAKKPAKGVRVAKSGSASSKQQQKKSTPTKVPSEQLTVEAPANGHAQADVSQISTKATSKTPVVSMAQDSQKTKTEIGEKATELPVVPVLSTTEQAKVPQSASPVALEPTAKVSVPSENHICKPIL
jgi:hypothetical protein